MPHQQHSHVLSPQVILPHHLSMQQQKCVEESRHVVEMCVMASNLSQALRKQCSHESLAALRPLLSVSNSDSLIDECFLLSGAEFVVFPGSHVQLG